MFCHLHNHGEYSLLDGTGKAAEWVRRSKSIGQTHLALTDHGNIDGFLRFQEATKKEGIKPIFGCELYVVPDMFDKKEKARFHLTALVKNEQGFQNLCRLLSLANLKGFYYKPRVDFESILNHHEGLIFLSGCASTPLMTQAGEDFLYELSKLLETDLYLEVMPHDYPQQVEVNKRCFELSNLWGIGLVATNDCHYVNPEDSLTQEVLLAIQSQAKWKDKNRWRFDVQGLYLKSEDEMVDAFLDQGILPKSAIRMAMRNTMEIAKKCESFEIPKKDIWLPPIVGIPEDKEEETLRNLCFEGYEKIFKEEIWDPEYKERFEEEFELIKKKKFVRYFLVVHELINWCKNTNIMCGPGRGSVGGSLIAYLIGITLVDPIKYGLLFSRFIDENRIDYPDIDIDFEKVKRHFVRGHLEELYGKNNISSVSTFQRMKARGVIRDVSRVFDVDLAEVDKFAKSIVEEDGETDCIQRTIDENPEAAVFARRYPDVIKHSLSLEGQIRGGGQHAAALIVSAEDLTQGTRGNLCVRSKLEVINWDMVDCEYLGLMKLDILGLNTLSILNETKRLIKQNHNHDIAFEKIEPTNPQVFEMLSKGETIGVFQFNTWSVTKMTKELGIHDFNDMASIIALVRPGPLDSGMAADFVERKHGKKWQKKHPIYEEITKETYGVLVYQEQIMQVISRVAGLSYSTADKIRKIVSKKRDASLFDQYKDMFVEGCRKNKTMSDEEADEFWEALQAHARYSFNKSHSVEYALIGYWCAFLKLFYPAEFLCANLTFEEDDEDTNRLVQEAQKMGLEVILPKVGISHPTDWVVKNRKLYVPFKEIKGVGEKTAEKYANFSPSDAGYVTKTKTITKKVGFFGMEQKQVVEKIKEPTKAEKILREIGALGDPPSDDIQKYFAFEIPKCVTSAPEVFKEIMKQTGQPLGRIFTLDIDSKYVKNIIHENHFRDPAVLYCKECELRKECSKPVMPSKGLHNVMVIGEAPGKNEDIEGKGFVGKAGDLLWKTIRPYGYSRRSFHVTNVCKCWPSSTKTPKAEHIQCCSKWLDYEIKTLNSKICLALGNVPLKYFKGEDGGIMKLCGTTEWIDEKQMWVCWGLHPSAVLRNPQNKKMFLDGIENFMNKIEILGGMK